MRSLLSLSAALLCALSLAPLRAQEPAPRAGEVRILFLPPPLEGTLSLGIYDKAGKLVRTLRSEADPEKDFTVGLNGLFVTWDGKDDAGRPAPAGTYRARGFGVAHTDVSGEAILGNDWYDGEETTPRLTAIVSLDGTKGELLLLTGKTVTGQTILLQCDRLGRLAARGAEVTPSAAPATGPGETTWVIEPGENGPEVRQYSKTKEPLRQLPTAAGDPVPKQVVASPTEEVIFVLEERAGEQRVRGLALDETTPEQATSTWKAFLSRRLVPSPEFASIRGELGPASTFKPQDKFSAISAPNPLNQGEKRSTATLQAGFDAKGSFLRTADGLRLLDISDTPHLRWVVIGQDSPSRSLTLFQSDGAVVEQFRLRRLPNLMAFDAGEYELKR